MRRDWLPYQVLVVAGPETGPLNYVSWSPLFVPAGANPEDRSKWRVYFTGWKYLRGNRQPGEFGERVRVRPIKSTLRPLDITS